MRARRWILFAVLAVVFFIVANNGDIYNATSPPALSWHILLRKAYSIVVFTIIGASFLWASRASARDAVLVMALYSAAIEVGQHFTYGHEPFVWNVIDVICGGIGGALAALIPAVRVK